MKHNPNIKLIQHFYNQGTFQARKNGIYFSTGKFIISLDSDDFFYPNAIEKLYQFSKQVDADVIDFVAQARKKKGDSILLIGIHVKKTSQTTMKSD